MFTVVVMSAEFEALLLIWAVVIASSSAIAAFSFADIKMSEEQMKKMGIADRKSTRLNSSHRSLSRMPSSA